MESAEEHEQLAEWLEELKELREYKKKMKAQFLDDIENPLEPIKLSSALESEIFKYEYRAEHDPQKISPLDYTIIYALKHCLEEQLKEVGEVMKQRKKQERTTTGTGTTETGHRKRH